MPLPLRIVTPESEIFSGEVDIAVLPGFKGEMGVLPQHAPLVTTLHPGELSYTIGDQTKELAVGEGLVEITFEGISVLTDLALGEDEIDEEIVEAAMKKAQEALDELSDPEEAALTEALIQKSMAQLDLKRKRRRV
ncbi:MAG: ATP synthase F1 subunit epsilon [Verrucomicrobiota bacterium]